MNKLKLISVNSGKVHISKNDKIQSLCGQAPWTNPVIYFEGTFEQVTCESCKSIKTANSKQ